MWYVNNGNGKIRLQRDGWYLSESLGPETRQVSLGRPPSACGVLPTRAVAVQAAGGGHSCRVIALSTISCDALIPLVPHPQSSSSLFASRRRSARAAAPPPFLALRFHHPRPSASCLGRPVCTVHLALPGRGMGIGIDIDMDMDMAIVLAIAWRSPLFSAILAFFSPRCLAPPAISLQEPLPTRCSQALAHPLRPSACSPRPSGPSGPPRCATRIRRSCKEYSRLQAGSSSPGRRKEPDRCIEQRECV